MKTLKQLHSSRGPRATASPPAVSDSSPIHPASELKGVELFCRKVHPYRASAKQLSFVKDLPGPDRFFMKPRFEPDVPTNADPDLSASLIDPEAFDASEQQFAASLEPASARTESRFGLESLGRDRPGRPGLWWKTRNRKPATYQTEPVNTEAQQTATPPEPAELEPPQDPDAWRREVAARLSHYRSRRRTREPRYPSLQLKFEPVPISSDPEPSLTSIAPADDDSQATDYLETNAAPRITLAEPSSFSRDNLLELSTDFAGRQH